MFKTLEEWWEKNKTTIKAQYEKDSYEGDFYHEWYENYKQYCNYETKTIMEYDNWQKIVFHNAKREN